MATQNNDAVSPFATPAGHGPLYATAGKAAPTGVDVGHVRESAASRDPRLVLADAREALEQQRWADSANAFGQLLVDPRYGAEGSYGLGWIELQHGSQERAEQLFRDAVARDPSHANAWFALGRLSEERSVDEAIGSYRRALAADPDHHSAAERLRLLDVALEDRPRSTTTEPLAHSASAVPVTAPAMSLAAPGGLGIVEFLQHDDSDVARDALDRIQALNRHSRFRFSAHLQRLVTLFVALVLSATALAYVLYHVTPFTIGHTTIHFYTKNSTQLVLAAAGVWLICSTWTLLECVTNTITIRNARIRWTHGVLNKHTETLDVWTGRDVELDRNLLQRLTQDGDLTFKGTTHDRTPRFGKGRPKPLRLTGIAAGSDLDQIYAQLLDLKFLLRAHPGLKGIVQ